METAKVCFACFAALWKSEFFVVVDRFDLRISLDRATKDMAFPYVISSTLGYENQPEVLKLFRRSSSRPITRSVELKCPNEQEIRRKSMFYLDTALDPTSPHPIVNSTEDTEASAVARAESKATCPISPKATCPISPISIFLEDLRKNEQFRYRKASLEALESEKDEE